MTTKLCDQIEAKKIGPTEAGKSELSATNEQPTHRHSDAIEKHQNEEAQDRPQRQCSSVLKQLLIIKQSNEKNDQSNEDDELDDMPDESTRAPRAGLNCFVLQCFGNLMTGLRLASISRAISRRSLIRERRSLTSAPCMSSPRETRRSN